MKIQFPKKKMVTDSADMRLRDEPKGLQLLLLAAMN